MCGFILFWNWFSETIRAVIYVQKFLWGQFSKLGERLKCDSSDLNVGASLKLALPSLNHTKFLFSRFHLQFKNLNLNSNPKGWGICQDYSSLVLFWVVFSLKSNIKGGKMFLRKPIENF